MRTKYRQIVLCGLLANAAVSTSYKRKILSYADDTWNWTSAIVETCLPPSCAEITTDLLYEKIRLLVDNSQIAADLSDFMPVITHLAQHKDIESTKFLPLLELLTKGDLRWFDSLALVEAAINNHTHRDSYLELFIKSENATLLLAMAQNESTPEKYLRALSDSDKIDVLQALAVNPATEQNILCKLANNHGIEVFNDLACNPNLPHEILKQIFLCNESCLMRSVAKRSDLDRDMICDLSVYDDEYVRIEVASKPNLPKEVAERLAYDSEESVQAEIAKRNDLDPTLLEYLFNAKNLIVARALAQNSTITDAMRDSYAQSKDKKLLLAAFSNVRLTKDLLDRISAVADKDWITTWLFQIRQDKLSVCEAVYSRLANSKNRDTREALASIDDVSYEILSRLAHDEDAEVRTAVVSNPKCSEELLRVIIDKHTEDGDFHLPLRIVDVAQSTSILETLLDKLLEIHRDFIDEYKRSRAQGVQVHTVPRDLRSFKPMYFHPLASEQIKKTIVEIYTHIAQFDQGRELAKRLSDDPYTTDDLIQLIAGKISVDGNEEYLSGFISSEHLSEPVISGLVELVGAGQT